MKLELTLLSTGRHSTNSVTVNLPANVVYQYDGRGNLTNDGNRAFAYDDENELKSVWVSNVWRSDFVYDGLLRKRIEKDYNWNGSAWTQTNETHYVYDAYLVIQERSSNNVPLVTYTRGNDLGGDLQSAGGIGGLLARTDNILLATNSGAAHAFYHCDGNGNVTALFNGAVIASYNYDPFGNILLMSGPLAAANTYRFSSKESHANSGLYYYSRRFYDPNLQRWVNRDPLEELGGINLYAFVFNKPLNLFDSFGLCLYNPAWDPKEIKKAQQQADEAAIAAMYPDRGVISDQSLVVASVLPVFRTAEVAGDLLAGGTARVAPRAWDYAGRSLQRSINYADDHPYLSLIHI